MNLTEWKDELNKIVLSLITASLVSALLTASIVLPLSLIIAPTFSYSIVLVTIDCLIAVLGAWFYHHEQYLIGCIWE